MAGEDEVNTSGKASLNLDRLRSLVRDYIDKHQYDSALFWADKVVSFSNGCARDLYWYAQALFLTGQYHRAIHLIKNNKLDKKHLACRYLAARCHYACKELQESIDVLDQVDTTQTTVKTPSRQMSEPCIRLDLTDSDVDVPSINMASSINLLRGRVYEAMDNRALAMECFREALRADVYCYEALDCLVGHHMLSAQEEKELMETLPFTAQCPEGEKELVKSLYENKLKKYNKPSEVMLPNSLHSLNSNVDIIVGLAERHYYNCNFREAFKITTSVLQKDPYNSECLPLHIVLLVEFKKANDLFYLAHKLVDLYPNKAVSWFAVGCYYLLNGKEDPARRYLSKATTLDRVYGPAWLAFGHSFAAENEHDQAMAAYFTAAQLMKGCHLPVLYIGLEYGLTSNSKLAERFFNQALSIAPEDPFVLHEMGVIAFQNQDFLGAERLFKSALEKIQLVSDGVITEKWESLLNNLGHTARKLKKYDEALEYHRQALILDQMNPSSLSSIGYVHALTGNNDQAVDYFHKALSQKRDDTFSTTMLSNAIEQLMGEVLPYEGVPEILPALSYNDNLKLNMTQKTDEDCAISDGSIMAVEMDMDGSD